MKASASKQQFRGPANLLLIFATCQVPMLPKHRASYQNFAVAISAKSDHSEASMILKHNGYSIEAFATESNRQWAVRIIVTWHDGDQQKHRLFGPYESFQSQNDAEAWGIYRCIELIESGLFNLPAKIGGMATKSLD